MDTPTTINAGTGRSNIDLAAVVDQALAVSIEHGAKAAARFLVSHGAGFALTVRVLAEPERRRARS